MFDLRKYEMFDLIIIGAGPAGISAAFEAKKAGLRYLVLEKGLIGNTIYNYPVGLTVFSTINELEIDDGGLKPAREKPTREELLSYYVRFALEQQLNIQTEETVIAAEKDELGFRVISDKGSYISKKVLFATGSADHPRNLGVKGENLPKVHLAFRETYPWVKKRALIIGGGNSAGEAALFLAQEGCDTTLAIFRSDWENNDPKQGCIKYWVKQPLEQELNEHCLNLFFLGKVIEIRPSEVELEAESGEHVILPNDVVFVLVGSDADLTILKKLGVETTAGKAGEVPVYNEETFETNVPGVYVAGHFTHQRHIKGAIDAAKVLVPKLASGLRETESSHP
jgi:thioredoxin reductase (NADPH)